MGLRRGVRRARGPLRRHGRDGHHRPAAGLPVGAGERRLGGGAAAHDQHPHRRGADTLGWQSGADDRVRGSWTRDCTSRRRTRARRSRWASGPRSDDGAPERGSGGSRMTANGTTPSRPRRCAGSSRRRRAGWPSCARPSRTCRRCCGAVSSWSASSRPPRGRRPPATPPTRWSSRPCGPWPCSPTRAASGGTGAGRRGGGTAHRGRRGRDPPRCRGARVAPGHPAAAGPLRRPGGEPPGAVLGRRRAGRRRRGDGGGGHLDPAAPGRRAHGASAGRDRLRAQRGGRRADRGRAGAALHRGPGRATRRPGQARRSSTSRRPTLPGSDRVHEHRTFRPATAVAFVRGPLPLLGPAFVAAIAYVDPGNFATNITAGRLRLPAAVGADRQQPHGHAHPVPLGEGGHRHRQEPGRALPRRLPRAGSPTACGPRPRSSPSRRTWPRCWAGRWRCGCSSGSRCSSAA